MAALFTPGHATAFRIAVIVGVLGAGAAIALPMILIRTPYASGRAAPVTQPVEFDHRHHVRDDGIDCVYCHNDVETSAGAGMPTTARCMGCHGQVWPDSPELAPVRASWRTGEPLRWKRVNAVPGYVYFHHGAHIQAGVACARCHGDVGDMARVERVHDMTMDFCLDCHRKTQGSRAITKLTTCSACHR